MALGICMRFVALGGAAGLAIAVHSLQVVKGFGRIWNTVVTNYPVFWNKTAPPTTAGRFGCWV